MTTKFDCSLKDTTVLRNLILENPDLPLIVFCGEEAYQDNGYAYSMANYSRVEIENLSLYNTEVFLDEDDYREQLEDDLANDLYDVREYDDLSDEEWDKMIDQKMAEVEFVKAIVLWVG